MSFINVSSVRDGWGCLNHVIYHAHNHVAWTQNLEYNHAIGTIYLSVDGASQSWKLLFFNLDFTEFVPIDKKTTLVKVMAWRRTGDNPLPDTITWVQ